MSLARRTDRVSHTLEGFDRPDRRLSEPRSTGPRDGQLRRIEALERRLAVVEDQEKIRRCLARHGFNADVGRSDEWVRAWAADGVYDLGYERHDGKAELRHLITSPLHNHKLNLENRSVQIVANLIVQIEGDTAWAEGYSIVCTRGPNGNGMVPRSAGYNHWDFVRDGDGWLMSLRRRRSVGGEEWGGDTLRSYLKVAV